MPNFDAEKTKKSFSGALAPKNSTYYEARMKPPLGVMPLNAPAQNYRANIPGAEQHTPISKRVKLELVSRLVK